MNWWNWKWNWPIPLYGKVNSNSNSTHFGSIPIQFQFRIELTSALYTTIQIQSLITVYSKAKVLNVQKKYSCFTRFTKVHTNNFLFNLTQWHMGYGCYLLLLSTVDVTFSNQLFVNSKTILAPGRGRVDYCPPELFPTKLCNGECIPRDLECREYISHVPFILPFSTCRHNQNHLRCFCSRWSH